MPVTTRKGRTWSAREVAVGAGLRGRGPAFVRRMPLNVARNGRHLNAAKRGRLLLLKVGSAWYAGIGLFDG